MGAVALGQENFIDDGAARVRAFFGLRLPEAHKTALGRYLASCAAVAPQFRWTPAANLHLTIRFLGHVDQRVAEGIADRLEDAGLSPFDVQLGGTGSFKRGRLARVVWMGLAAGAEETAALAAAVEAECVLAGLEPEARRFNAHLTLARARARDGAPLAELPAPPDLPAWRVQALVLFRSHLGRAGSVYEPLRTVSLG